MASPSLLRRAAFACLSWPGCLVVGLLLRLVLIALGEAQDAAAAMSPAGVKYTDIDYAVYSDASALMLQGHSPYARATYRYTPLLAAALLPGPAGVAAGVPLAALWGKLLFSLVDLTLAVLARRILLQRGLSPESATHRAAWPVLFNPLVINLSTRGNADALIVALVLALLVSLQAARVRTAAVLFGLAVHVKLYPIIYAPAIVLFLNEHYPNEGSSSQPRVKASSSSAALTIHPPARPPYFLLRDVLYPFGLKIRFFLWSAGTFFLLTGVCYAWCGFEFLFETYFYHVTRVDTRHNFSVYFLQLYLESSARIAAAAGADATAVGVAVTASGADKLLPLLSFLPQCSCC